MSSEAISVVGHTAFDLIFKVPFLPKPNNSTYVEEREELFGGGAANIAAAIATLGGRSRLISPVGMDFINSDYEEHLVNLGVDLDMLTVIVDDDTARAYVFTDEDHDQVTYFYWGASRCFPRLEAPRVDFVHLATADASFNQRVAEKAGFVSFDPGQDIHTYSGEQLHRILRHTDILFTNEYEIEHLREITGLSCREVEDLVDVLVVTYGGDGSRVFSDEGEMRIPVVGVNAVDPTGAGDAYRAGFLLAWARDYDLEACAKIGSTVASYVVESVGPQTSLPTWEEMIERYRENFGELG